MAGFLGKVSAFARSPQGRRIIQQVQTAAKDPATRAKVQSQAQEISKKLKDPQTRAKVQEHARGLSDRFKEATGSAKGTGRQSGSGSARPSGSAAPTDPAGQDGADRRADPPTGSTRDGHTGR